MAVNLSPVGGVAAQFFTNSGTPLTGGKIFTYAAGTTTPQATYTSSQGNVPWTNPIVLDAAGRVPSGGEIWLTDGLTYKFLLKDANDVLIATYDNISGINSNFIAFTNQQEIVTATAGQTVFNLGINYQPGTNSLSVFVDGVNQYGPGAQYAYVETDSNTVTFTTGLHVGAEVKFTTSQQQGAGAVDAEQVSYTPPFTGSVPTNVEVKLAQTVSVTDFGAVGDGVTNDKAAIALAVATGKAVVFPEGTYYLGEYNSSNDVGIDCSGRTVHFTNIGKVKFTIRTATGIGDCFPTVFRLYNSPNSTFGDFYFEDLNVDLSTTNRRGLKPYRMTADAVTGTWGNVSIGRIYCHDTIDAIAFDGADAVNRVQNITIQEIHLDNCYYGVQAQNQGDNVFVGVIYANQVRRVYFPYGVTNHRATIYDKNHLGSTATIYIQRGVGGFDTKDIYINYSCYDTSQVQTIVRISHLDLLGGTIKNINLNLDVDVPVSSRPLYFVNFDGAGNETNAPSLNVVDEVYVTGRFGATAQDVDTYASYLTNTGKVSLAAEGAVAVSATTAVKFIVRDTPITYTPVWSTSGTAPSLGNGTLTGRYEIVGDICNFFIGFTAGSTTTFGTGAFEFTLPKPAAYDQVVTIWGEDNGVANYIGLGLFGGTPSRSTVYGVSNASGATWAAATPFAWGSGDRIRISGSYIVQN